MTFDSRDDELDALGSAFESAGAFFDIYREGRPSVPNYVIPKRLTDTPTDPIPPEIGPIRFRQREVLT